MAGRSKKGAGNAPAATENVTDAAAPAAIEPATGGDDVVQAAAGEAVDNAGESGDGATAKPEGESGGEDHITAFDRRMERLVAIAEDSEFETGTLVGDIRDALVDVFKNRPKPWSQMSAGEQADQNRTFEAVAKTVLRKLVLVLAEEDSVSVHATLKGYAVDGETFKLKVVAKGDEDTAAELFRMDGHDVILIRADARRHFGQRRAGEVMPDQPGLSFADGGAAKAPGEITSEPPRHPDDDSDLAGVETRISIATGMIEAVEGSTPATLEQLGEADPGSTWRVNKETGLVQRQPQGSDEWEDIREATPEEIGPPTGEEDEDEFPEAPKD